MLNTFKFKLNPEKVHADDYDTIFEAEKISDDLYEVRWDVGVDTNFNHTEYKTELVKRFIEERRWIVIN